MNNVCESCLCKKVCKLEQTVKCMLNNPTTITVNKTTTLPAGLDATVVNVGTPTDVFLNFGIPTGKDGAPGVNGKDGVTPQIGDNGNWFVGTTDTGVDATGPLGIPGIPGTPGKNGTNGTPGIPGIPGVAATVTVGTTTTGTAGTNAIVSNVGTSSAAVLNFTIPKGDAGTNGGLTAMHVWIDTTAPTYTVKSSDSFFGINMPKNVAFSSIQGVDISNFTSAGGMIKVNTAGLYLVTYQFVVKGSKCDIRIRRNNIDVPGGNITVTNVAGELLVSGAMMYLVTDADIATSNNVFDISNASNTDLIIDPKSFSWTATKLSSGIDPIFVKIPFK